MLECFMSLRQNGENSQGQQVTFYSIHYSTKIQPSFSHHMKGNSLRPSRCMLLFIDLSSACSLIIVAQALHYSLPQACQPSD